MSHSSSINKGGMKQPNPSGIAPQVKTTTGKTSGVHKWDHLRSSLVHYNTTKQKKEDVKKSILYIRDSISIQEYQDSEFETFLLPYLIQLLYVTQDDPLIAITCECLLRYLPTSTTSNNSRIVPALLHVLPQSWLTEDSILLMNKFLLEYHKQQHHNHHHQTPSSATNYNLQPFFDFVQTTYRNLPHAIQLHFSASPPLTTTTSMPPPPPAPTATTATTTNTTNTAAPLIPPPPSSTTNPTSTSSGTSVKGMYSFRVLTECPLTVMLLFQLYPKYLKNNIPQLIPLMMDALFLRPPPYSSSNQQYHGKARELMAAQVKTLSFLTYLLRGFTEQMKPHQERIASSVISLLTYCPKEALSVRKELLVATRHVLATEYFRNAFETRHVDAILEERILLGTHKTGENLVLRPLAYSTLADLVHHVRSKLSMSQLHRVVHIFARVLHDTSMSLPLTIQATSIRLLCNMVDQIYHNTHPQPSLGRDLLFRILETLVKKFETLVTITIPHLQSKQPKQPPIENETTFQEEDQNNNIIYNFTLENKDTMAHVKDVIQPMLLGLKTVIWCVNNYGNQRDKLQQSSQQLSERDQVALQGITSCERNIIFLSRNLARVFTGRCCH